MFNLNTTIDDSSPQIIYSPAGAWLQRDLWLDPQGDRYWAGSKTWTQTLGATATFRFHGTGITIRGSKRGNHGPYIVTLDGNTSNFNGYASDPGDYQAVLFAQGNLEDRVHEVVIANAANGSFLDIDCIEWVCAVDSPDNRPGQVQDTDPSFRWFPAGAWDTSPQNLSAFNGASGHSTSQAGASVNYTFSGDAILLYGTIGPENSPYSVQIDGKAKEQLNATRDSFQTGVLLYQASGLGPGNHTLTAVNDEPGKLFQIDYATVYSAADASTSSRSPLPTKIPGPSQDPSPNSAVLSTGAIVGISISTAFVIFLFFIIWLLMRRNKTLWNRLQKGYMVQSQFDITPSRPTPFSGSHHPEMSSSSPPTSSNRLALYGGRYTRGKFERIRDEEEGVFTNAGDMPTGTPRSVVQAERVRNAQARSDSLQSDSTLVAEDGSQETRRQRTFKLITGYRWSLSQRTSSQPSPAVPRSASTRHLLESTDDLSEDSPVDPYMHSQTALVVDSVQTFPTTPSMMGESNRTSETRVSIDISNTADKRLYDNYGDIAERKHDVPLDETHSPPPLSPSTVEIRRERRLSDFEFVDVDVDVDGESLPEYRRRESVQPLR